MLASHADQVWPSIMVNETDVFVVDGSQSDHAPFRVTVSCDAVPECHANHVWPSIVPDEVDVFEACESHSDHALLGGTMSPEVALELELCFESVLVHWAQDGSSVDTDGLLADVFNDEPGVDNIVLSGHCTHACGSLGIEAVGNQTGAP